MFYFYLICRGGKIIFTRLLFSEWNILLCINDIHKLKREKDEKKNVLNLWYPFLVSLLKFRAQDKSTFTCYDRQEASFTHQFHKSAAAFPQYILVVQIVQTSELTNLVIIIVFSHLCSKIGKVKPTHLSDKGTGFLWEVTRVNNGNQG
jgi:hypothetical protein